MRERTYGGVPACLNEAGKETQKETKVKTLPGGLAADSSMWRETMSNSRKGSLGYQMMKALQSIFHPGTSRHNAKRYQRETALITSINTMRCMTADVHQFARFVRETWPEIRDLADVQPEMALAYIADLEERGLSGGWIGRVCASLRKLDAACRQTGIFSSDKPALLPHKDQGGPGGFHSISKPVPYTAEQAQAIIEHITPIDPDIARLLSLMDRSGLRVQEACYLRAQDIFRSEIRLNQQDNANRTKGGRPRIIQVQACHQEFLEQLQHVGKANPTGHIFKDRQTLPDRARQRVRQVCQELGIPNHGTHGFRKHFANQEYRRQMEAGANDRQALLATSHQLGHNRINVTIQSYIPIQNRVRAKSRKR